MKKYNPQEIEKKWQKYWEKDKIYEADDFDKKPLRQAQGKPKYYALIEFPYLSGDGLHVGHVRSYTAIDIVARKRRMEGYNTLYPIGWDAFGLPAENYAIKTGIHPRETTKKNADTFRRQLKSLGFSFDWDREISTADPEYYKWTQWMFIQFFKHGLAYKANVPINWCKSCKIGLANEEVVTRSTSSGQAAACERCGGEVEKRNKDQWMIRITKYADRLLEGLKTVDYIERARVQQENWIGRSEGALIRFNVVNDINVLSENKKQLKQTGRSSDYNNTTTTTFIDVFTTRPDTIFGATYLVLSPDYSQIPNHKSQITNWKEVNEYIETAKKKNETDRTAEDKSKTGIELRGLKAINPATKEEIPIWVADYVMTGYGTGAIMAVPAHDERDFEFAKKYNLPIREVIEPCYIQTTEPGIVKKNQSFVERDGVIVIVKHWSEDKYIGLKWKKVDWQTLITGGIEEGQTAIEAAQEEIKEETGYQNARFVRDLGMTHGKFYHVPKKENRLVHGHCLYFELENGLQQEVSEKEKEIHDVIWVSREELDDFLFATTHRWAVRRLNRVSETWTGEGFLKNSGLFDGQASEGARKNITKKYGTPKTEYKLRDWVFSRQRYWGEPIPLVHCRKCVGIKSKVLLIHGIYGHSDENWFSWFRKTMTERGYDVSVPNLPNPDRPNIDEWLTALKTELGKLNITDNDHLYIVGHSMGGPTACQFIRKNNLKVEKLILVGPTGENQDKRNWQNLRSAGIDEEAITIVKKFNAESTGLSEVKKLVKEVVLYLSDDDPFIPLDIEENYKKLDPKVRILSGKGHFNESAGIIEFPDILDDFPEPQNGWIPVPDDQLPVALPDVKNYKPTDTGESPLAAIESFVNTTCPKCNSPAKRETDVMPNWAGSSWYFISYCIAENLKSQIPISKQITSSEIQNKLKHWMPIDWYNGGMEHTVLHLLYSRFWNMFLHDIGVVPTSEPYKKRTSHGFILGEGGIKMSKSKGNVINPDDLVSEFGADSLRLYEMFIGPFDQMVAWDPRGILGPERFLKKVWTIGMTRIKNPSFAKAPTVAPSFALRASEGKKALADKSAGRQESGVKDNELERLLHQTIKKVSDDIENMSFNTAVSALMIFINACYEYESIPIEIWKKFLVILAPFAPHIAEELYQLLESPNSQILNPKFSSIHEKSWPEYDEKLAKEDSFELVIQVNGKMRGKISAEVGLTEEKARALAEKEIQNWLENKEIKKVIFVKDRLINFIV